MTRFAVLFGLLMACSSHDKPKPQQEPERPKRVIEPPSRGVRALPPYGIRADGIGPYKLGATETELLDQSPRLTQLTIPGLVRRDLLRAEDDAIVIGAEPEGKATFVAVLRSEIARTDVPKETAVHVGSSREELVRALGAPVDDPYRAHDPHLLTPASLKTAHIVMDGDHIAAIVIANDPDRPPNEPGPEPPCTRPADDPDKGLTGICLTTAGEFLHTKDDSIYIVMRDGEKPITTLTVPDLLFAAALRNPLDNRDDLVAISRTDDGQSRTWSLSAFRLAEGKLVPTIPPTVLFPPLTAASARLSIGADLKDLDLYLELTSRADTIEVGGLLTTRISPLGQPHAAPVLRDIVVISTVPVPRRRAKPSTKESIDAGTLDTPIEHSP